jgi:hypothetical protein
VIALKVAFVGLGALILALNASVTRRLWASAMFERGQKVAQTILLWLLPGSVFLVWAVVREPSKRGEPRHWIDTTVDALTGAADDVGGHGAHGGHDDHPSHVDGHGGLDGHGH